MDAGENGSFFSVPLSAPLTAMSSDFLSDSREALETNLAVTMEGSRAVWNGLRAVCEETGAFFAERVRSQGAFAEGLMGCYVPAAFLAHVSDYWRSEIKAWDEEQGKMMGLFAQALTDAMLEADSVELAVPKAW